LLTVELAIGSIGPQDDTGSSNNAENALTNSDFDKAFETIATSTDPDAVKAAAATLRNGGIPAINVLRKHLSDKRFPPPNHPLQRAVRAKPTMGVHAFWLIQAMVETRVAKAYQRYSVLTPTNVEQWLDARRGKSILELQVDAATASLKRANRDVEVAQQAIELYSEQLRKLREQRDRDKAKR
jgi:hypothetical protein